MDIVTDEHLRRFGYIIHTYACAESGIRIILARYLEMEIESFLVLSEPYSTSNLINVAKSVNKAKPLPDGANDRFAELVGRLKSFGKLRNFIAHSRWTSGSALGSIKPLRVDIRSGRAKFEGTSPGEKEWTLNDLGHIANNLGTLNNDIVQFIKDLGPDPHMDE